MVCLNTPLDLAVFCEFQLKVLKLHVHFSLC